MRFSLHTMLLLKQILFFNYFLSIFAILTKRRIDQNMLVPKKQKTKEIGRGKYEEEYNNCKMLGVALFANCK